MFDRVLLIGVGAGACGKEEKGIALFGPESVAEVTRIGYGDCSGVGTGRSRGRRGAVSEADSKLALYRRASLFTINQKVGQRMYARLLTSCEDSSSSLKSAFGGLARFASSDLESDGKAIVSVRQTVELCDCLKGHTSSRTFSSITVASDSLIISYSWDLI
jgi:hypothetical protein